MLADARGQTYTWLLENYGGLFQRGEGGLVQISDPRRTDTRDLAVATGAVVTFNYASNGGFIQVWRFTVVLVEQLTSSLPWLYILR